MARQKTLVMIMLFSILMVNMALADAHKPKRIVSLSPAITEIIVKLGEAKSLVGVTYHDTDTKGLGQKAIMGGFFSPSFARIMAQEPDLVFAANLQKNLIAQLEQAGIPVMTLPINSIDQSFEVIERLGQIFAKPNQASELVRQVKEPLAHIAQKLAKIPNNQRQRVIRLMGFDDGKLFTPGSDSFQNEVIRAAGGLSHNLNRNGNSVEMSQAEWEHFNPQVIYACGNDTASITALLQGSEWRNVDAVKNKRIFFFPCQLTCRAATNTGYFVQWLSSSIYPAFFADQENQRLPDEKLDARNLDLDLDYVKNAQIIHSRIGDFTHKSLTLNFNQPMRLVSTLEGWREDIQTVGNHFIPPPLWGTLHKIGLEAQRKSVYKTLGLFENKTSFLFTGADMDNLSVQKASYQDMAVYALVTAGVRSNAMRMSVDEGRYVEGTGTINIILLTNRELTARGMTRAIVSTTEAKTAALTDMDVRSAYSSKRFRATGTGTDNVMVIQGTGQVAGNTGGHAKLGELIAKAVYAGVSEAVFKQNGLIAQRDVFQRLRERKISLYAVLSNAAYKCEMTHNERVAAFDRLLMEPEYAAFIESAFSISDDYEKGLIQDLGFFDQLAQNIAGKIAGHPVPALREMVQATDLPIVLQKALNTILNGIYFREQQALNG